LEEAVRVGCARVIVLRPAYPKLDESYKAEQFTPELSWRSGEVSALMGISEELRTGVCGEREKKRT
jgi:hypothetical protein